MVNKPTRHKVLAIVQARMSSTRLPGKVLRPILGRPMLAMQLERIAACRLVDQTMVATSTEPSDDAIAQVCAAENIACYRGSLADVLGRFAGAAQAFGPCDHVVRLTGDCPLTDPAIVDACIALHLANGADYTSNSVQRTYPDGLDVEVIRFSALLRASMEAKTTFEREHVTPYLYRNAQTFVLQAFCYPKDLSPLRWTVDLPADFEFAETVFQNLYPQNNQFSWLDVLDLLKRKPEIVQINQKNPL